MDKVEQLLREGDLSGVLKQLQEQVKKNPANASYRTFLFQLLAVLGQWQRALTQLNVAGEMDAANLAMMQAYREVIACEVFRKSVFSGVKSPLIFGDPQPWIALLLEALKLSSQQEYEKSAQVRAEAFDQAPTIAGSINGVEFDWIADADSRIGPVLEVIINGQYYWVPFDRISVIHLEEPTDLRDLVWMPAHFMWTNQGEAYGFIPARYPGSEDNEDNLIKLGRKTEWQSLSDEFFVGQGQKILTTNIDDYSLLDIREIKFKTAD
jgi:type VI secretion system protein ImpE